MAKANSKLDDSAAEDVPHTYSKTRAAPSKPQEKVSVHWL